MNESEIIPTDKVVKPPQIEGGIMKMFETLPQNIKDECLEYFAKLPLGLRQDIEKRLGGEKTEKSSSVQALEEAFREDRAKDGTYTREDLSKFDEIRLQLVLRSNFQEIFSSHLKSEIIECKSFDEFRGIMEPFINGIWTSRGQEKITYPRQTEIDEIENRRSSTGKALREAQEEEQKILEKVGNKKRLPNDLQTRLSEIQNRIIQLKDQDRGMVFDYHDWRGKRVRLIENKGQCNASVYISEYFSAEDYAILCLEIFSNEIDFASRFDSNAHPELLDFVTKFFGEWEQNHRDEKALITLTKMEKSKRTELLIERFVAGLESFERQRSNPNLSQREIETMVKELPNMLRMLARQ